MPAARRYRFTRSVRRFLLNGSPNSCRNNTPQSGSITSSRPHLLDVAAYPVDRTRAQRHIAVFLALALADHERAVLQVHVVELEVDQLGAADAAGVERLQDGAIAQRLRIEPPLLIRAQRERHHLLDLLAREDVRRQAPMHARQLQLGSRIGEDVILACEPLEEHPQRDQPLLLGGEGQRLAVVLAVVVQMAPVTLQDRPGDVLRGADAALIGPADEAAHAIGADCSVCGE